MNTATIFGIIYLIVLIPSILMTKGVAKMYNIHGFFNQFLMFITVWFSYPIYVVWCIFNSGKDD